MRTLLSQRRVSGLCSHTETKLTRENAATSRADYRRLTFSELAEGGRAYSWSQIQAMQRPDYPDDGVNYKAQVNMAAKSDAWKPNCSDHQRAQVGLGRANREASRTEETEDSGVAGLARLQSDRRTVLASPIHPRHDEIRDRLSHCQDS